MAQAPVAAVLMCHAPIVIPIIAGNRAEACASTTAAMREAARTLVASEAHTVVLVSPHLPRHDAAYGLLEADPVRGDFRAFGRPDVSVRLEGHPSLLRALRTTPKTVPLLPVQAALDHGALVPLWFLAEAGFTGHLLVLGLPWDPSVPVEPVARHLRSALDAQGESWAILASGDCSHALQPGAPGGFHPDGARFDAALAEALERGIWADARQHTRLWRGHAAEDVVESLVLAAALLDAPPAPARVLSYEGPFGVGYTVADLQP